jgi:hypothetical protein
MTALAAEERRALGLDAADPFPTRRAEFCVPPYPGDRSGQAAYFAGNSLGLQPRALRARLGEFLDDWARLGVEGHLEARRPWLSYHELLRGPAARLVGALPEEVVVMNSLTVNLHLLMASFYRPTPRRHAIVIEDSAFPSDSYAVRSQAALHGYDPDETVIRLRPRRGEATLRTADVVAFLRDNSNKLALVLLGAVNYYTGEFFDMEAITRAGREAGAVVGWDLAESARPRRRLGRLVLLQVPQQRRGLPVRGIRPLASPRGPRPAQARRLVVDTGVGPVRDGAGAHPRRHGRLLADLQPADPVDGRRAAVPGDVRPVRHAGAARQERAADRLP